MQQLETAFNTNTKVFHEAIFMLEVQNAAIRRAAQDVLSRDFTGRLPRHINVETGVLDWNAYIKEYVQELHEKEELEKKEKDTEPLITSPTEDVVVFGG